VGTFGGRGAVSFNGGANYLNFAQSIVNNTNYTIFVVMHRNGTTANSNFIGTQSAVGAQGLHLGFNTDTSARVGHDSGNTLSVAVEGQALNSVGIFWARLSSSGKTIYYNAKTGTDATATKLSNPGQGVIGRGLDTDGLDGQIAEIIVYNRDLMDMEVDLIEEYLRDKWLNPSQAPNMRLWLDASDTSSLFSDAGCTTTTASGGNVRCWSDKSGSGYQAKQGSGTPIWSPDGGRNSVKFTSDNLVVSSGVVGALFDAGGTVDHMTVVALARSTSSTESGYLIHHSAGADITASIPFGANTVRMQVGGAGDGTVSSGAWGAGTVAPHYWFMSSTTAGPAQYIYRDNNLVTSDATASSVVIGTEDFYIGSDSSGANFQTANIHELLVFKRALTNAEREMLRAYFMNKWDL
jgi:hypothetical protein